MKKAIIKWVGGVLLVLLVFLSFGYNVYNLWTSHVNSTLQQGFNLALNQIVSTVKQNGEVSFPITTQDGKQETIILIQKSNEPKK